MEATWRQKEPNDITVYKQRGGLKAFVTACLAPFASEALNLLLIFPGMNLNHGKSLITPSAETETPGEPGEALPSDLSAHGGCLVIFKIQYLKKEGRRTCAAVWEQFTTVLTAGTRMKTRRSVRVE